MVLTDDLPPETGANSVSNATVISGPNILPFSPAAPASGAIITFQTIPTLAAGAGGAIEFDMQTNAGAGATVKNLGKLASALVPVTSYAVSTVVNTAYLNIAKSVAPTTAEPGGTVTYTITVSNGGNAAASTIVIDDFLPSEGGAGGANNAATRFNFVAGSTVTSNLTAVAPTVTAPSTVSPYSGTNRQQLTWNFGAQSLAAGASATISFQAIVGANVPRSNTPYTNDAKAAYNAGTIRATNTAAVTVPLLADVAVSKTGPATVTALGSIKYSILVQNNGPSTAANVALTDSLPAGVVFVSATGGGIFNAGPNTVTWPPIATLANGATQSYTLVVNAPANGGPLTNRVSAISATSDPTPANNDGTAPSATVVTTITPMADLSITKTDASATYTPGAGASYTITVSNAGPSGVIGAAIADNLPLGVVLGGPLSCTASVGSSCSAPSGGVAGGDAVALTVNLLLSGTATVLVPVQFSGNPASY